jgi:hypothetical protein
MYKIKNLIIVLLLLSITTLVEAQNSGMNSPYTRFGYGDINTNSSSASQSMGGIGIGYRAKNTINSMNPASYSNIDTMKFIFDFGASYAYTKFSAENQPTSSTFNGNFDFISFLFPISKFVGVSFGLSPFSTVGYNFSHTDSIPGTTGNNAYVYKQSFNGSGGLNQVYGGLSAKFFDHLSVGVNTSLVFGNITHYEENTPISIDGYYTTSQQSNLYVHDFRLRYGVQYFTTINQKHDITIGVIYEHKSSISGNFQYINSYGGNIIDTTSTNYGFDFPSLYGAGLYYTYNKKLSFGFDYSLQKWSEARYYGTTGSLNDVQKLAFGAEYLPDIFSKKTSERIHYRIGTNFSNLNSQITDATGGTQNIYTYAVTAGVGIPIKRNASLLNISCEYGKIGKTTAGMVEENYFKVSVSSTFIESWFSKSVIR